jgi:hypothetical protein
MNDQPKLSDAEWGLVIELLQQELHELPVEIRHTRSSDFSEDLHRRLEMVRSLVARLRAPVAA